MTINELYKWISNPSTLTKSSLSEIRQLVDEYPYFQAARILYLKNLSLLEDVRFQKELKRMSVYVPDRRRLFMLIEKEKFEPQHTDVEEQTVEYKEKTPTSTPTPFVTAQEETASTPQISYIEKQPVSKSEERIKNQYITIAPADYISWLEANTADISPPENAGNRLKHQDLIDSFIESDVKLQINPQEKEEKKPENESENETIPKNETFDKNSLDDSYFTETLARVYFSQKRYDKALEIIRVLNLKYPEKNAYFADQIRYLEKLINIKK